MTLPSSGAISMSQVNTELGAAATTTISLNQANVRTLAGVPSGTISMSNLYGKSNWFYVGAGTVGSYASYPGGIYVGTYYGWSSGTSPYGSISVNNAYGGASLSNGCYFYDPAPGYGSQSYVTKWTASNIVVSLKCVNTSTGATVEVATTTTSATNNHSAFSGTNVWGTNGHGWALYVK